MMQPEMKRGEVMMKSEKSMRRYSLIAFCAVVLGAHGVDVLAQSYPSKPIRFLVPFTAGGCPGSRRGGWCWGGDGAVTPGLWHCAQRCLALAMVLLASLCAAPVFAQNYPSKPIRFLVPFTAGGGADAMARQVAPKVSERLGQQLVVENRGAAGGTVGTGVAAKAAPDGYTIVLTAANIAAAVSLFDKLTFDPLKDFAAVTLLAKTPSILAVHPSLPVKSVAELIALAKSNPGKINYAGGIGSLLHLDVEYFKTIAKIDLVQVPYNGSASS
jgi:tripartite-type tricarboxylate transporter receptor subunit TctC